MLLNGLVLCGGKSSRMGTDKGTLKKNNVYWVEIVKNKLKSYCNHVYISINKNQLDLYSKIFNGSDLIIDSDYEAGPLSGIKAFSEKKIISDLIIMPCDMIDFDESYILNLIEYYQNESSKTCFSFSEKKFLQPFPCIIKHSILEKKINFNYGFFNFLEENKVYKIELLNDKTIFSNYNKPEEIK